MYMECASSDTASLLTAPELTRLSASHPWVLFAGIVKREDVVFAHVAGEGGLILKPGLDIIGGVQPRAFREPIPCVLDIDSMFDIDAMLDIGVMLDIGAMLDIGVMLDIGEVEVICIESSVIDVSFVVISATMLDPPISILFFIPVILIGEVSLGICEDPLPVEDGDSSPRSVSAWRK